MFAYCENQIITGYDPTGFYNRNNAIKYAQAWYNRRNQRYYSYTTDCANFVSQCLYAGGIKMTNSWHSYKTFNLNKHLFDPRSIISYKFWYDWDVTRSWRLAADQYNHFSSKTNNYIYGNVVKFEKSTIKHAANNCKVKKGDLLYFVKKTLLYHIMQQ